MRNNRNTAATGNWLSLTKTPNNTQIEINRRMLADINNKKTKQVFHLIYLTEQFILLKSGF